MPLTSTFSTPRAMSCTTRGRVCPCGPRPWRCSSRLSSGDRLLQADRWRPSTGRGRWKIENENNNVLKTKGYHIEHNFGHGQQYLAAFLLSLNLIAFLFHTVLEWYDDKYALIRQGLARRQTFFADLRALTRFLV